MGLHDLANFPMQPLAYNKDFYFSLYICVMISGGLSLQIYIHMLNSEKLVYLKNRLDFEDKKIIPKAHKKRSVHQEE